MNKPYKPHLNTIGAVDVSLEGEVIHPTLPAKPLPPHPVEVAITGFFKAWASAVVRTVLVILMILSFLFTALQLGITVIGGLSVWLGPATLDKYWWSYPLLAILGIGLCVLFTRTRQWALGALADWVDRYI